ncbi:MAG: hypothetical protein AAF771_03740 [Pseudomonadota bacterium]
MTDEIRFYISIFLRRLHIFILVTGVVAAGAAYYALRLPAIYTSDALLLIEAPRIPDDLAAPTVQTNPREQLEIIEQRLLTRANLLDIANDVGVFENPEEMFPDQIVNAMRNSTVFEVRTGRDRATIFTIAFNARDPQVAAAVVNAYVTSVLDENVEIRTGRAGDAMEFFAQEVDRLAEELARQSQRILDFKNENIDGLPESLGFRMGRQETLITQRGALADQLVDIEEARNRMLRVVNSTQNATQTDGTAAELPTVVAVQMQELGVREDRLLAEIAEIDGELEVLEASIAATPGNAVALETLERDYDNIQRQYDLALRRQSEAATGERIELLSKGERILVLNQPIVPRGPSSPNRRLIMAAGLAAGMAAGAGLIFLLEFLNRAIRRPVDISRTMGITPLATLPVIRTPGEIFRRRAFVALLGLVVLLGIPAALWWAHLNIAPLDLLIDQGLQRIGIGQAG